MKLFTSNWYISVTQQSKQKLLYLYLNPSTKRAELEYGNICLSRVKMIIQENSVLIHAELYMKSS